jgi:hypothetical protein
VAPPVAPDIEDNGREQVEVLLVGLEAVEEFQKPLKGGLGGAVYMHSGKRELKLYSFYRNSYVYAPASATFRPADV